MEGLRLEIPRYGSNVPGLPDRAIVYTNSERGRAQCPLKWLFGGPDRLKTQFTARPLNWGTAWHEWLEDVHTWWMETDSTYPSVDGGWGCVWCHETHGQNGHANCTHCDGTSHGPLRRSQLLWAAEAAGDGDGTYTPEMAAKEAEALYRCADGWAHTYGLAPPADFKVVGVELCLAVPVPTLSGKPYAPHTWVCPDGEGGLQIAGTGEAHAFGAKRVRWPWYQCFTVDALFQHRTNGGLYVGEHKSAASPIRRVGSIVVDPQLSGYVWATQVAVENGVLESLGLGRDLKVHGYRYDVASNQHQPDPKLLAPKKVQMRNELGQLLWTQAKKDGGGVGPTESKRKAYEVDDSGEFVERSPGFSTAQNSAVPTWRFRSAVISEGFSLDDYEEHIQMLSKVDLKLYQRLYGTSGPEVSARYARELYAVVKKISTWRRNAAKIRKPEERDVLFPRDPVCIAGYSCPYKSVCLQDGDLARRNFDLAETQRWVLDIETTNDKELGW